MNLKIDEFEIRKTIATIKPNAQLFEIRFISNSGRLNFSGYFTDAETLIDKLKHLAPSENGNVYITLNEIDSSCYSREQRDKFVRNAKTTTDENITGYDWLMMDFDPERPSGISSSETELKIAHDKAVEVYKYLSNRGWSKPIVAMSGNGYHLLYKVNFMNNSDRIHLVENTLKTLNILFGDNTIKIDTAVFNPSRICKLYGTMAVKGSNTKERPHRMSKLLSVPEKIEITSKKLLEELISVIPQEPEKPREYNSYNPQRFNLEDWIIKHKLKVTQKAPFKNGGIKYILSECPFDSSHKGKDACLMQLPSGAICFHCFHASCSGHNWKSLREMFEPTAYSKKEYHKPNIELPSVPQREITKEDMWQTSDYEKKQPVFFTTNDIRNLKTPHEEFIKTGITEFDKKLRGLKKGFVTCLSGLRASGKSSIISQITIEAAQQGYRTALYSGELMPKNLLKWLVLQSAGKNYVESTQYEGYFVPKPGVEEKVAEWLNEKVFVYNNDYGNNFAFIMESLQRCVDDYKVDLIILDNLMMIDIAELDHDIFQRQSKFVGELEVFAKNKNVHILFVAHPRKSQGFLRLDDISGSNDIVNRVDNALILHRKNEDYKRLSKETMKWKDDHPTYADEVTNVIEICKDRDGGVQDYFIPLYFEIETKRLKSSETEFKIYGWESDGIVYDDLPF